MPIGFKPGMQEGSVLVNPFVGPVNHTAPVRIDPSTFKADVTTVDRYGYLKSGVLLRRDGTLITGAGQRAYGMVVEPVKVAESNSNTDLDAAPSRDVAVAVICMVNRKLGEDNLGRVYSANELAAAEIAPIVMVY